jgi:hypothetical protein
MAFLGRVGALVTRVLERRRLHWVEISLARAWSHDLQARLFDLDNL